MLPAVWIVGTLLELLILLRGWYSGILKKFAFFYTYLAAVSVYSVLAYVILKNKPAAFPGFYWFGQFITLLIGCALILEIFSHVLSAYPGVERFAKFGSLTVFGLILCVGFIYPGSLSLGKFAQSEIELERNLRTAQIVLLMVVVGIVFYYAIPIGRNIRGIICGYGLYLGTSLLSLALRSYLGTGFDAMWRVVQPLSFDFSLLIWLISLWIHRPNPLPAREGQSEADYETLVSLTKAQIEAMRSQLGRSTRS